MCHVFFGILSGEIHCTLTNLKPVWEIFYWHLTQSKLINGSITLHMKFVVKCRKIFPIMTGKVITILKPGWNLGPLHLLQRCISIWLRCFITLWAGRSWRLWKTGWTPLHGIEIREVWMGQLVVSIWHWKSGWQLCGGIDRTVMSGHVV